jgi:hypothetical protein
MSRTEPLPPCFAPSRVLVLPVEGPLVPLVPREGESLWDAAGRAVDGWIEVVRLGDVVLLVDEDGLLVGKPLNVRAMLMAGQRIVGTVVLVPSELVDAVLGGGELDPRDRPPSKLPPARGDA